MANTEIKLNFTVERFIYELDGNRHELPVELMLKSNPPDKTGFIRWAHDVVLGFYGVIEMGNQSRHCDYWTVSDTRKFDIYVNSSGEWFGECLV